MAIKNIFGRGIGFGAPHWIVTHGYDSSTVVVSEQVPSPHRVRVLDYQTTLVDSVNFAPTRVSWDPINTALLYLSDRGDVMAQPLVMTAGETGPITFALEGADGTRQDVTGAAVTLRVVQPSTGTVVVNAVAMTLSDAANGEVTWTRTALQTATAGDYMYQIKAVLADASVVFFPDGNALPGSPLTIFAVV